MEIKFIYWIPTLLLILFKGKKGIADKIDKTKTIYVPVSVLGELYLGAENSDRKRHHLTQIDNFLKAHNPLEITAETARMYGLIKYHLRKKGTPVPENDIWIAALAQEHGIPVITNDKHFQCFTDIKVIGW